MIMNDYYSVLQAARAGQGIEQRGLPRVGVADESDHRATSTTLASDRRSASTTSRNTKHQVTRSATISSGLAKSSNEK